MPLLVCILISHHNVGRIKKKRTCINARCKCMDRMLLSRWRPDGINEAVYWGLTEQGNAFPSSFANRTFLDIVNWAMFASMFSSLQSSLHCHSTIVLLLPLCASLCMTQMKQHTFLNVFHSTNNSSKILSRVAFRIKNSAMSRYAFVFFILYVLFVIWWWLIL